MAIKGQTFKHYPESLKIEAVRLHFEESWSYRKITEQLDIQDKDRVKRWMSTYRKSGIDAFKDNRGNPSRIETEQESAIKDLWNGEIIAYHINRRNDNPLVLEWIVYTKLDRKNKG